MDMLLRFLCIFLITGYILGCTADSTENNESGTIFPTPPVITEEPSPPVFEVPILPDLVDEKVEVPPVEPIAEDEADPDPEPIEEDEEPKDKTAPRLIDSSVSHGDVGVDPDIERFVFTFDEEIGRADIELINNTQKIDMQWTVLIDGKRVILLRLPGEGRGMKPGELYTLRMRWRDEGGNWNPADFAIINVITFTTEIKE